MVLQTRMFAQIAITLSASVLVSAHIRHFNPVVLQPDSDIKKCLTASGDLPGAAVTLKECTGAGAQAWSFVEDGYRPDGSMSQRLQVFGNKCLDLTNTTIGAIVLISDCLEAQWGNSVTFDTQNNTIKAFIEKEKEDEITLCLGVNEGDAVQTQDCAAPGANIMWHAGYLESTVPITSEDGQIGTNQCGEGFPPTSWCSTLWLISEGDYCVFGPSEAGGIGTTEVDFVSWCNNEKHGGRDILQGAIKKLEFLRIPEKNQVKVHGEGDFTKIYVLPKERFALGARANEGRGRPAGAILFNDEGLEFHEWRGFINATHFCLHACMGQDAIHACDSTAPLLNCNFETARRKQVKLSLRNNTCMATVTDLDSSLVILQQCDEGANIAQMWFLGGEEDYIWVSPNKCLVGGNVDNKLRIASCKISVNQKFFYNDTAKAIVWSGRDRCVAVANGATSEGSQVNTSITSQIFVLGH